MTLYDVASKYSKLTSAVDWASNGALNAVQVNFHTTVSGQAMVTMIYHRKLDADWIAAAQKLREVLGACPSSSQPSVHIIGRSRKQKVELDAAHVIETFTVDGRQVTYKQVGVDESDSTLCLRLFICNLIRRLLTSLQSLPEHVRLKKCALVIQHPLPSVLCRALLSRPPRCQSECVGKGPNAMLGGRSLQPAQRRHVREDADMG